MAARAAMTGLQRCVRAFLPCRPWKFRFEVDAQWTPAGTRSGFIPRHIEQPGSRHSKPASLKILSKPIFSAALRTGREPGTTMAVTFSWTFFPAMILAASCRSESRPLVQEPIKT